MVFEGHRRDSGRNIESVLTFDRYRLKRDRLIKTADQHVRARTHS